MLTHNTKDCRISKENVSGDEQSNRIEIENKHLSNYSTPLFHDSGTSKTMLNYKTKEVLEENLSIPIFTAGKNQKPEVAVSKGILKLGPISLETLEVPTFSKNLLSATQLAIEHGCKQVIEPWTGKLIISKDKEIVATGSYDHSTKLIKIDDVNQSTNLVKEKIGNSPKKVNNQLLSENPIKPTPTPSKATTDD